MSKAVSQVAYVGPDVDIGSMDVRELAPALLSLGELCEETNRILNGQRATLEIRVQSRFERGSFQLYLELTQTLAQQVSLFLTRDNIATAADIASLIGLIKPVAAAAVTGVTLLQLLKWLRGRVPDRVAPTGDGNVLLTFTGDQQNITVNQTIYQVASDPVARRAAAAVVNDRPWH